MWCVILGLWLSTAWAQNKSNEEAEIQRIREVMEQRYKTNTWVAVDKAYREMMLVNNSAHWMKDSDHVRGAMASSASGNLAETVARLQRVEFDQEAIDWKHSLLETTGPAQLVGEKGKSIQNMHQIFSPEQLEAIAFANSVLATEGKFDGRLPIGAYYYGDKQLLVSAVGIQYLEGSANTTENLPKTETKPENSKKKTTVTTQNSSTGMNTAQYMLGGLEMLHIGLNSQGGAAIQPMTSPGIGVGYGYEWQLDSWRISVQPELSVYQSSSTILNIAPTVLGGWASSSLDVRLGIRQQSMVLRNVPGAQGESLSGFLFAFSGLAQIGWNVSDTIGMNARISLGTDKAPSNHDINTYHRYSAFSLGIRYSL